MAFKMQQIVDLARIPLNDADKARHSDTDLMSFANHALLAAFRTRPDFFIGSYDSLPNGALALASNFPLPEEYVQMIADYVTARAETVDDEHVNSNRATLFFQLFGAQANG